MPIVKTKPTSAGRRRVVKVVHSHLYKGRPYEPLVEKKSKNGGRNNNGGALSGNAGSAFAAANGVTGLPMSAGSLWQHGSNNEMTVTVTGDDNLFAVLQRGSGNALVGTVIGANNQAAVAQNGNNNTANFVQNGSYNNLGIIQ